jgi:hypothetical protein
MKKFSIFSAALSAPVGLCIYNVLYNRSDFFKAPLYYILNIFIAIIFAYFLTQHKTDERKRKDLAVNLISKIQLSLEESRTYNIKNDEDLNYIRITQRSVNNRLHLLEKNSDKLKITDELDYVNKEFARYWEFVSTHISDLSYLKKSEKELFNFITNIMDKLEEIIFKVFD